MEGIQHKFVSVNGIIMHVAEAGKGPVVLFLHGFPECWYTWRHQMTFMASHGYRAVAPDLRGYGETTGAPTGDPSKFTTMHVVGDLVALIDDVAADEGKVFVVGHDWGAQIAWSLCLYRPDKVKALVAMSVFFSPRNPSIKPLDRLRSVYGDDYYISRFQEAGEIEGEFAVIGAKKVVVSSLANSNNPNPFYLPKGKPFEGSTQTLPSWVTQNDVDFYVSMFEKTGFTGALNYYRSLDLNWELTAAWSGAKVSVPTKFIVGNLDLTYNAPGAQEYLHKGGLKKNVPLLEEVVVLEGVGHFLHEEKPQEINTSIYNFLHSLSL